MIGGMGSGKTSIFYYVTKAMEVSAISTIGHNAEFLLINKEKFVLYDIGAKNLDFHSLTHVFESAVAVVFVIDASD